MSAIASPNRGLKQSYSGKCLPAALLNILLTEIYLLMQNNCSFTAEPRYCWGRITWPSEAEAGSHFGCTPTGKAGYGPVNMRKDWLGKDFNYREPLSAIIVFTKSVQHWGYILIFLPIFRVFLNLRMITATGGSNCFMICEASPTFKCFKGEFDRFLT